MKEVMNVSVGLFFGIVVVLIACVLVLLIAVLVADTILCPNDNSDGVSFARLRLSVAEPKIESFGDIEREYTHAVVVLPGILAKHTQFTPMLAGMYGYDVYAARYVGVHFDRERVVFETAKLIAELNRFYDGVVLVGISHGALLTLPVIRELQATNERLPQEVQLHDGPTGGDTFKPMPRVMEPVIAHLRPGPASNIMWAWFLPLLMGLPKDENIKPPPEDLQLRLLGGVYEDAAGYREWVKKCAEEDLSGHLFSMWWGELRDMILAERQGLDYAALEHVSKVTYIECIGDMNDVVEQPLAADRWQAGVPHMKRVSITAPHCAYREQLEEFAKAARLY